MTSLTFLTTIIQVIHVLSAGRHTAVISSSERPTSTSDEMKSNANQVKTASNSISEVDMCSSFSDLTDGSDVNQLLNDSDLACKVMALCGIRSSMEIRCPAFINDLGTCFPETRTNETAYVQCAATFGGIEYDTADNITRACLENGTWAKKAKYNCRPILEDVACDRLKALFTKAKPSLKDIAMIREPCDPILEKVVLLSLVGRVVSLVSLVAAFLLFWNLESIRCSRIVIHWNLTASLMLKNVFWLSLRLTIDFATRKGSKVLCKVITSLFQYSQLATFYWMLVEGIHLHIGVAMPFTYNAIKLQHYYFIGWISPLLITAMWASWKAIRNDEACWLDDDPSQLGYYLYSISIFIILLINALILGNIVRILLTKLRAETDREDFAKYRKAIKSAFLLLPLLGGTYLLFLISPEKESIGEKIFLFFNTFLQSFQGFFVCVIYCFANSEVQGAVLRSINRWRLYNGPACLKKKKPTQSSMASFYSTTNIRMDESHVRSTTL